MRRRASGLAALVLGVGACLPGGVSAAPDREYGAFLAGPCVTCHQVSGTAAQGVPAIIGWPAEAFIAAMEAFRSGVRPSAVMRLQADGLSDEEIAALAAYFGELKPAR
ncbi:c-type cytochrome [Xanthobacter autotrophicus DSM 431]|uniref:c-type cytochrome n=1 Tax=Xanthobacter nonsaccharivorans TaxID=3119912 RepID=UPI003729A386